MPSPDRTIRQLAHTIRINASFELTRLPQILVMPRDEDGAKDWWVMLNENFFEGEPEGVWLCRSTHCNNLKIAVAMTIVLEERKARAEQVGSAE